MIVKIYQITKQNKMTYQLNSKDLGKYSFKFDFKNSNIDFKNQIKIFPSY